MLIKMGAKIEGLDTDTLVVTGVESLHGCEYAVVADRIETGSYWLLQLLQVDVLKPRIQIRL